MNLEGHFKVNLRGHFKVDDRGQLGANFPTLEKLANAINVPVWKLFLTDEEIREVNLLEDKNLDSNVNGYIKVKGTVHEIHSFEDLEKVLKLKEE